MHPVVTEEEENGEILGTSKMTSVQIMHISPVKWPIVTIVQNSHGYFVVQVKIAICVILRHWFLNIWERRWFSWEAAVKGGLLLFRIDFHRNP